MTNQNSNNSKIMSNQNSITNTIHSNSMDNQNLNNSVINPSQTPVINNKTIQPMYRNTIMKTPNFVLETVNPNDLKAHSLLTEMGFDNKPDAVYIQTANLFKYYEKPVVDCKNNIITHSAEVFAAIANGVTEIEVYKTDMTEMDFRTFMLLKHTYNIKNLIATYSTINFYLDYFKNDEQGILIAESMKGKTTTKIACLMQTSDSTIKRVKTVGDYDISKLGLIEQGYLSFKEVEVEIKKKQLMDNAAKRKAESDQPGSGTENPNLQGEYYESPGEELGNDETPVATEPYYGNEETEIPNVSRVNTWTQSVTSQVSQNLLNSYMNFEGFGEIEITMNEQSPVVKHNGEVITDLTYTGIVNREDSGSGGSKSFIIAQKGKLGKSIQITLENFPNAA